MDDLFDENGLKSKVSDVLNGIFNICDENRTGLVQVSLLISFLKEKAAGTEISNYFSELIKILDREGTDPFILQQSYEKGMRDWIHLINQQIMTNDIIYEKNSASVKNKIPPHSKKLKDRMMFAEEKFSSVGSTYSNDSMEVSEMSWDNGDYQGRLDELEIANKRLTEDISKLKKHLHLTEDQNSFIIQENDGFRKQVIKFERLLEESRVACKNYEELKSTVVDMQNYRNELLSRTQMLEKENNSLQATVQEYESKICQLDVSLELAKEEKEKLADEFFAQKQLLNQIDELRTSKEDVLEECTNKSDYMTSVIAELSLANEVLKAQKNNAENEVSELKQEINRVSMMQSGNMMSTPICSRGPPSLHHELHAELSSSAIDGRSPISRHYDFSDCISVQSPDFSPRKYTDFAHQCKQKFREKREEVFQKIEEIVNSERHSSDFEKTSVIVEDLDSDLESFTEKIAEFAHGKQDAEKRAMKLAAVVKKLQEENVMLQEARDKALLRFADLSMISMETETKMHDLAEQLASANKMLDKLQQERDESRINYERRDRSKNTCPSNEKDLDKLRTLVEKLERLNEESTKKIQTLEAGLSSYEGELEAEKVATSQVNSKLITLEAAHAMEMESLFQIVSNDKVPELVTFRDVQRELERCLISSRRECNKLLGIRESPEGDASELKEEETNYYTATFYDTKKCDRAVQCAVMTQETRYTQTDVPLNDESSLYCSVEETAIDNIVLNSDLVEFERSDISSESENESRCTERTYRNGTRIQGVEHHTSSSDENNNTNGVRRRRQGVSAEPTRVSWSSMRDSLKSSDDGESFLESLNTKNQEECASTQDNSSLPIIEVNDADDVLDSEESNISETEQVKKDSLQVPSTDEHPHTALLLPANCQLLVEDVELEKKFHNAVFAFNTDQFTLQRRLQNQERARDLAESGMEKELLNLKSRLEKFTRLKQGSMEYEETIDSLDRHCDVLEKAAMKISAQSEQHGCYQQEHRMTESNEVMIAFVEHLKLTVNRLNDQLDEYKLRASELSFERSDVSDLEEKKNVSFDGCKREEPQNKEFRTSIGRFSAVSRSLLATQRMKRRVAQKRVSFGRDVREIDDATEILEEIATLKTEEQSSKTILKRLFKYFVFIFVLLSFILAIVTAVNAFEVDHWRLIDVILRYIPHTVETPGRR